MSGLVSYGGDPKVSVARSEIDRITSNLGVVQKRLLNELQPLAQIAGIVHHVQLDTYLPETLVRLGLQRHGLFVAGESYFTADAQVAHRIDAIANAIHKTPLLRNAIPKQVWEGLAVGLGVAAFTNSNATALGVQAITGQLPLEKISDLTAKLPSSPISVEERPPSGVYQKPQTLSGLAERLNNPSGNIRIESLRGSSGRVLVVYLPGTAEWNPLAHEKAFDVRSDIELLGTTEKSASYRAANAALSAFGATSEDRLILVGYSQGGMVAADIAQQEPNVIGVVTMGSPIAREHLPTNIPVISLEHSNDVVPALAGATNPITDNWVTATRHVDLQSGENVLKAHNMSEYVTSANLADQSSDSGLVRLRQNLFSNLQGTEFVSAKEYAPLKAAS